MTWKETLAQRLSYGDLTDVAVFRIADDAPEKMENGMLRIKIERQTGETFVIDSYPGSIARMLRAANKDGWIRAIRGMSNNILFTGYEPPKKE